MLFAIKQTIWISNYISTAEFVVSKKFKEKQLAIQQHRLNSPMMMKFFCGMVDLRKAIFRDPHLSNTLRARFEPAQYQILGLVELSRAVVITTTPRRHIDGTTASNACLRY